MKLLHDPNLVFYADLAKHDGGLFMSDDAYGYKCTVTGATWGSHGRTFAGGDDFIGLGNVLRLGWTDRFSILAWFNTTMGSDTSRRPLLYKGTGTTNYGLVIYSASLYCYMGDWGGATRLMKATDVTVNDGAWHFGGFSYDGSKVAAGATIFLDEGQETGVVTDDDLSPNFLSNATVEIGRDSAPAYFTGSIGEEFVYNRTISLAEYQHLYLATKWRYR